MFYWLLAVVMLISLALAVITENMAVPLVVGVLFVLVLLVFGQIFRDEDDARDSSGGTTHRCPNCGSPVRVHGNRWECGWCGNHGDITSLRK